MNQKIIALLLASIFVLFFCHFFPAPNNSAAQAHTLAQNTLTQSSVSQMQNIDPIAEQNRVTISEEQAKDMERLLKMPTGRMNDEIYVEILAQVACHGVEVDELDDATANKIFQPYEITFEEWLAYHWQLLSGKLDMNEVRYTQIMDDYALKLEELRKNDCELTARSKSNKHLSGQITPEIWIEITARIRCLDRTLLSFTKDEIKTIFTPFGVTPAEYQTFSEEFIEILDPVFEKDKDELSDEDSKLIFLSSQLKIRVEELKANNCILEDGTKISQEYDLSADELEQWDNNKCRLFSCSNCLQPSQSKSWWNKFRCSTLCKDCPVSVPEIPAKEDCAGFCSTNSCPSSADEIAGNCLPKKICKPCGLFNLFRCCQDEPAVCCQTKPLEVCQGSCGVKECPTGMMAVGTKNCPRGKEKYKCYIFFKCTREVEGVCCISY